MYRVKVQNTCSCFLKSGFPESQEFKSKEEAKTEAEYMLRIMKSNFCQKHEFAINEQFDDFTIFIKPRA
jgi:hypothetical protein